MRKIHKINEQELMAQKGLEVIIQNVPADRVFSRAFAQMAIGIIEAYSDHKLPKDQDEQVEIWLVWGK